MTRPIRVGTLKIHLPVGQTVLAAAAILAAFIGVCEAAGRGGVVLPYLLTPMVSGHDEVGLRLEMLATIERQDGPVDCFIIGSSTASRAIDPRIIAQKITARTGKPIRCFNFGLVGLSFPGAAKLAEILVQRYHPRLIVYGMNYRDSDVGFNLDIPWANQQLGQQSLEGWLETESTAYRYALGFTNGAASWHPSLPNDELSRYGYAAMDLTMDVSAPPRTDSGYYVPWHDFQIAKRQKFLTWLRRFLSLKTPQKSLAVVEMPVPQSILAMSDQERQQYEGFIDQVRGESQSQGVPLIAAPEKDFIPANGWQDYLHLNRTGAAVFTDWVAQQLAEMASQGIIAP